MLKTLAAFPHQNSQRIIGLMSGTSLDGVDAALCEIWDEDGETQFKLLAEANACYSDELRARLLALCQPGGGSSAELCRLNYEVGETFAVAAQAALKASQLRPDEIDAIGSHGQTVWHIPPESYPGAAGATLQLGEAAVIAERTGIAVVSNFRARDMAAGGQGAPLVPYVDYLLLSSSCKSRVALNIGGIANLTHLPAGGEPEQTLAFDTGPGNMVIDWLVQSMSGGGQAFDRDGAIAASGQVERGLLAELLQHEFLKRTPPKSTGREMFGAQFARKLRQSHTQLSDADLIATATAFTAASICQSIRRFVLPMGKVDELIVSGGGALNATLMAQLRRELPELRVALSDEFGIPLKSKEAIAFAVLAREALLGRPANLPSATGAKGPRILGQLTLA